MAFSWLTSILNSVSDLAGLSSGEIMEWNGSTFTNVDNFTLSDHSTTDHSGITGVNPTGLLTASVTVSSAQILALFTTPIQLIAAPGAGSYIIVESVTGFNDFGTGAYTVNAAGIDIGYSGGSATHTLSQAWGQSAADRLDLGSPQAVTNAPANTAIVISAGVANPTGGDGEWDIDIFYRIVTP